jgi:Type II secretion system (T2SS), protein E, N-terminal domain
MEGEEQFEAVNAANTNGETAVRAIRPSLLSLLVEAGVAPEQELRAAAASGMGAGERLGDVVLRNGWLDEIGLAQLLAQQWRLPFVADEAAVLDEHREEALPLDEAETLAGCPIAIESGVTCVAIAEPATARLDALRKLIGPDGSFAVVTPATLRRLLAERRGDTPEPTVIDGDIELGELLASLAAATDRLTTFREQFAEVTAASWASEQELKSSQARIAELEQHVADERERSRSLRAKLAALVDELDP